MDGGEIQVPDVEPELTTEQRAEMRQSVIDNLKGIHDLIAHYQQAQQQLQDDVTEFVLRDVDEQNKLHCIGARVETSQVEALKNPAYVRWASAKGKGEFAERRTTEADDGADDGSMWYEYVEEPFLPRAVVPLDVYSGVAAHLAGWRGANSSILAQLEQLTADLVKGESSSDCCVVINGEIIFPAAAVDGASGFLSLPSSGPPHSVEATFLRWWNEAVRLAGKTTESEQSLKPVLTQTRQVCGVIRGTSDVISIVPVSALSNAIILRFFARAGAIKAVEVLSPEVDVASAVFPSTKKADGTGLTTDEQLVAAVQCFAQANPRLSQFAASTIVVVLAVKRASAVSDSPFSFVALDGRQLQPELAFKWFLSWSEACGLSQLDTQSGPTPVRRCKIRVAQLTPNDELTEKHFPGLNDSLLQQQQLAQPARSGQLAAVSASEVAAPEKRNSLSGGAARLGLVVVCSIGVSLFLVKALRNAKRK
jgi:hypothetical protein